MNSNTKHEAYFASTRPRGFTSSLRETYLFSGISGREIVLNLVAGSEPFAAQSIESC
jgi:hypothetical protein